MMPARSCAQRSRSACASAERGGRGAYVDGAPIARGGASGGRVGCCACSGVAVRATATRQTTASNTAVVDRTTFTVGMITDRERLAPRASRTFSAAIAPFAMLARHRESGFPVPRSSVTVCDGDDQNASGFDAVDDAERITPKQVPTCAVVERRPSVRELHNRGFGRVDLLAERSRR